MSVKMEQLKKELIFKKEMLNILKKYEPDAILSDLSVIGFHENKFSYNFKFKNKKYVHKINLKKNFIIDHGFILRNFDDINTHFGYKFKEAGVSNKKDMNDYLEKQSNNFIDFLESDRYNQQKHLIEKLDQNDDFIIFKFYDFNFFTVNEFKENVQHFRKLWDNEITPICLGRGNVGYTHNKKDFIMYDIDLLSINNIVDRIFMHTELDDDDCWLSKINYKNREIH